MFTIVALIRIEELTNSYDGIIEDKSVRASIADTATSFGDHLADALAVLFGESCHVCIRVYSN